MDIEAREYLLKIPFWTKKKNTPQQVRGLLMALGDPEKDMRILHVAGTNGKGSVCADLTYILREAGYRVGTFISPHLVDIRERFLLDGELVGEADFQAAFRKVLAVVQEKTEKDGYHHPTYFEFVFLMAMVLFAEKSLDYVILETGLGGRLDTTNVVRRPQACVITSISLDHTQYLGDTVPQIAGEKAGIIKPGVPVIYDDNDPEASAVIGRRAEEMEAPTYPVSWKDVAVVKELSGQECVEPPMDRTGQGIAEPPMDLTGQESAEPANFLGVLPRVPFNAPYQAMNAALALRALEVLRPERVTEAVCAAGLAKVRWPGRMEKIAPGIWLDGAHNPGGIRAFIQAVQAQVQNQSQAQLRVQAQVQSQSQAQTQAQPQNRSQAQPPAQSGIQLLFAAVADKDYREMIHLLCTGLPIDRVTVVHLKSERGLGAASLAEAFRAAGCPRVEAFETAGEALTAALAHKSPSDRLYIVGSLYLIGEIKERLSERAKNA